MYKATRVVLWLTILFQFTDVWSEDGAGKPVVLDLLVYNTHGLPTLLAFDQPRRRFPIISALANQYDLSLFQEDFAHHDMLLSRFPRPTYIVRGEDPNFPPCAICSGSGLTFVSNLAAGDWTVHTTFEAFERCSGWLSMANDCFAQKGFQLSNFQSSEGLRLWVINTHLDAGRSESDRATRKMQLAQLTKKLEEVAKNETLVIAGDLNLDWANSEDQAILAAFSERLGLILAEKGGRPEKNWRTLDYVYYRSGENAKISVLRSGEDITFEDSSMPLSDHPAIFVKFLIE